MAQAQLIDRYLVTLQRSLGKAPDADDILTEVEDHLREATAAFRRAGLDAHAAETRTLQTFGSPKLVARAFADARRKKGIAMPTSFTRRAGLAAIVCPLALVAGMLLTTALALRDALVGDEQNVTVWPYGFLGIAIFGLGLTWLGWQLWAERPVRSGHGMAPAA